MKKILIASAFALSLCFTSCASKQAADPAPQTENAPQIETETDNSENEDSSESDKETDTTSETAEVENPEAEELTSEDFPEPEAIEEPEIVTLEPVEEVIIEAPSEETEPVENEEPPEIILVEENTEESSQEQTDTEVEAGSENEASTETETTEENSSSEEADEINTEAAEDISANDVIIVSKPDTDNISGGIDITDDDEDSEEEANQAEIEIIPSRSVTLKKFEYLDVTYPGSGWIYMGLTDNSKDIAYFGRKLGTKDTKFTLQARAAGKKIIHFYRNDPLTSQYLDDYIEVIIQAENGSNKTHIEAPEFKLPVKKIEKPVKEIEEQTEETEKEEVKAESQKSEKTENPVKNPEAVKSSESTKTVKAAPVETKKAESPAPQVNEESSTVTLPAADSTSLLQEAQLLYNEKEYKAALSKLNQFFEFSTDNRDQALYLKGQILEEKSDIRDIKGAIDAYSTLTKNYPASKYWDSANKRIIYLKRFYLEVR